MNSLEKDLNRININSEGGLNNINNKIITNNSLNQNRENNQNKEEINPVEKFLHPRSYFNLTTIVLKNVQLNAPYPRELKFEDLVNIYPVNFLEDYYVKDMEGVFCKSEEIVKKQGGVITDMAKQVAKGIFGFSGIVSISLPIRIFEPRSMLERYSDWWCFAPILLRKAAVVKDKLEAFKQVICFVLSAICLSSGQMKPFNPLLGETFEAGFEDGTILYMEHTSHTPCVSHYLMTDPDDLYKFSGYFDISLEGTMKILFNNSVTMVQKGKNSVYLKGTNQTISFQYPKMLLGGMIYGTRYVLIDGFMKFEDRENNMKAYIYFNKNHPNLKLRRVHDFYGQIYHHPYPKKKEQFFEEKMPKNPFPSDKKLIYSEITGSWLENIIFDNEIYWSVRDASPPQIYPVKQCAPSDSRYREDLIWLKRSLQFPDNTKSYEEYAQTWKVALEIQQRHDRSLRDKKKKK
jgi:hypothetical protein